MVTWTIPEGGGGGDAIQVRRQKERARRGCILYLCSFLGRATAVLWALVDQTA